MQPVPGAQAELGGVSQERCALPRRPRWLGAVKLGHRSPSSRTQENQQRWLVAQESQAEGGGEAGGEGGAGGPGSRYSAV